MKANKLLIMLAVIAIVVFLSINLTDRLLSRSNHVCPLQIQELTFEDLLDAIEQEESGGDPSAVCPDGCCVGAYQITKIYIDDCNRILKLYGYSSRVNYEDRRSRLLSRDITRVVTSYYANKDGLTILRNKMQFLETAARTHKSPSRRNHKSTEAYWQRIKGRLNVTARQAPAKRN